MTTSTTMIARRTKNPVLAESGELVLIVSTSTIVLDMGLSQNSPESNHFNTWNPNNGIANKKQWYKPLKKSMAIIACLPLFLLTCRHCLAKLPILILKRDHQKNFLWSSRLWIGRRKEPFLGYVPKNDKKKKSAGKKLISITLTRLQLNNLHTIITTVDQFIVLYYR